MATRTADARKKWAEALQQDLGEIKEHLGKALDLMRAVESDTRGVNGLPAFLRAKGNDVEQMVEALQSELDDVPAKLSGEKTKAREPIVERVAHPEMVEAIQAAKGAEKDD